MIATSAPFLRSRLTLWLAFLAVAAHVGLGWASAHHHAQMLAIGAGAWAEVCTPYGIERLSLPGGDAASQDTPQTEIRLGECVVCAVAGLSALPTLPPAGGLPASSPPVLDTPATDSLPANNPALRPPPRAPPSFS